MADNGGPAFPVASTGVNSFGSEYPIVEHGMSLRAYIAAQALTGIIAFPIPGQEKVPANAAKAAVEYADALIAELRK